LAASSEQEYDLVEKDAHAEQQGGNVLNYSTKKQFHKGKQTSALLVAGFTRAGFRPASRAYLLYLFENSHGPGMKKIFFLYICIVLLCSLPADAGEWRDVSPGDAVKLPGDLYFQKAYRVQWWYFTGHLYDAQGREFGYELTFFAAGVQQRKYESQFGVDTLYLSHFAISDVEGGKYFHFSSVDSGAYGFAGADSSRLHVWVDTNSLEGDIIRMRLRAHAEGADLDLVLVPKKHVVLNGDNGYSRKSEESPLIASLYFSTTALATTGTVTLNNTLFSVKGKSWFDRELSTQGLAKNEAGWDWFALQLADGREIMLYLMRKKDGSIDRCSSGTLVDSEGNVRHLAKDDYRIEVLSSYTSKKTGIRYPAKWDITIPREKLHLVVIPLLEDQEFTGGQMRGNTYWEGTCGGEGSAQGRAYVEMTGYEKH
jgi:predicted secreted hydrolase